VSDFRFYIRHVYACPICLRALKWKKRPKNAEFTGNDSLMLDHELHMTCPNSGKKFYAPVQQLTEIPVFEESAGVRKVKRGG
jgi:C4-type Zn-finger protein